MNDKPQIIGYRKNGAPIWSVMGGSVSDPVMDLMNTHETSEFTRVPIETLRYWRWRGEGPPSFKLGRRVMYRRADVVAWIESARREQVAS